MRFNRPESIGQYWPALPFSHLPVGLRRPYGTQIAGHNQVCGRKELLITLERAVGARLKVDSELAEAGSFTAEVYPDLPVATSWAELFGNPFKRWGPGMEIEFGITDLWPAD